MLPIDNPTKSYWIEAAESPLRNFRSSDELPKETDVVIVGSGYTGASTAYWLQKHTESNARQPKILMLEARDICGGATGRNGGQLRPHAYSRYPIWSSRFGAAGALDLIKHEMAHLSAFKELLASEGITEKVCLRLGETFDAAMTEEAWTRLKGAYEAMKSDWGEDGEVIRDCRLIEDPKEAEEFTQMKGCLGAVVHPAGQVWPYKFVHELLRICLETGNLNLQSETPVSSVSNRDADGWIVVKTSRGEVRTKAVVHATNRWAAHLLPEFDNLISSARGTIAAVKAPEGFIKHTGAQHWDSLVNNYHNQLPPPYNTIMVGGAQAVLVHDLRQSNRNEREDQQFEGVPEFYKSWPKSDILGWEGGDQAELGKDDNEGGVWTGVESRSIDSFPFVGVVPNREGHFIASAFTGHGMPRILLSTAHITPLVLQFLGFEFMSPALVKPYPSLPKPFLLTAERLKELQNVDGERIYEETVRNGLESAKKWFCQDERSRQKVGLVNGNGVAH
ncbi:FAD dependent oxidoreductase-domain-containing protein [Tricladium varicosporioides]|nr:FAD dependent oxidoreductase-domain-containing protein [Hymenoscyphus varicosporioides]